MLLNIGASAASAGSHGGGAPRNKLINADKRPLAIRLLLAATSIHFFAPTFQVTPIVCGR